MARIWTETTRLEWIQRRDSYRAAKKLAPLTALCHSGSNDYEAVLSAEQRCLQERLDNYSTKTIAWELEKHAINDYRAPFSGTLCVPLTFRERYGALKVPFQRGDDLNQIVFMFYDEKVPSDYPGDNYVSHGLQAKRHEFLGPRPMVSGYQFSDALKEASIEWWDQHVGIKWIGRGIWENEVYFDHYVQGWVSKLRGDFSRNLDLYEYMGCGV